jgi:2-polyprenyl-3-methyl-5-hydroxy-6-metoxy-1,4-benzoquinol methylase
MKGPNIEIKISGGMREDGIAVGNVYDKYGSNNPFVRWMIKKFSDALSDLVARVAPKTIHEIGCGEGYWVFKCIRQGIDARGSDFSEKVVGLARENAKAQGFSPSLFSVRSIYDIEIGHDSADLIVCCEVLEHLEDPHAGLKALQQVATDYIILSVPREPIWCLLNLFRGKYLSSLGNTPGHIHHWSTGKFIGLVSRYFHVMEAKTPFPWTMLLCRVKR